MPTTRMRIKCSMVVYTNSISLGLYTPRPQNPWIHHGIYCRWWKTYILCHPVLRNILFELSDNSLIKSESSSTKTELLVDAPFIPSHDTLTCCQLTSLILTSFRTVLRVRIQLSWSVSSNLIIIISLKKVQLSGNSVYCCFLLWFICVLCSMLH